MGGKIWGCNYSLTESQSVSASPMDFSAWCTNFTGLLKNSYFASTDVIGTVSIILITISMLERGLDTFFKHTTPVKMFHFHLCIMFWKIICFMNKSASFNKFCKSWQHFWNRINTFMFKFFHSVQNSKI